MCAFSPLLANKLIVIKQKYPGEERDFPHLSRPALGPTQLPVLVAIFPKRLKTGGGGGGGFLELSKGNVQ